MNQVKYTLYILEITMIYLKGFIVIKFYSHFF